MVEAHGTIFDRKRTAIQAANIYERAGDFDAAIRMLRQSRELESELLTGTNLEKLAEMNALLENLEQQEALMQLRHEAEMAQLKANAQENRFQLITIGALVVVAGGIVLLVWQRRMNRQLLQRSLTDSLTQLPNRRGMLQTLDTMSKGQQSPNALLWLMDLDKFKQINDQFGHEAGDQVLTHVGKSLSRLSSTNRMFGRWGGEEFIGLTKDIPIDGAEEFARQLNQVIQDILVKSASGQPLRVTASIGYGVIPNNGEWEELLNQVDAALYQAKAFGGNQAIRIQ